jgi:hypothetical protein
MRRAIATTAQTTTSQIRAETNHAALKHIGFPPIS